VKKIIALDSDVNMCSNNAAFVITLATVSLLTQILSYPNNMQELFIQYLAEQGHRVVKSERKPRRNIQYRDLCMMPFICNSLCELIPVLANAVAHQDNLEFLVDVVPRTVPFKQVKEKKAPASSKTANGESSVGPGQTTLDGRTLLVNGTNGTPHSGMVDDVDDGAAADPNAQLEMETRRVTQDQNGWSGSRDVEMS
jgi:DNA polymerase epsilon subunit 4